MGLALLCWVRSLLHGKGRVEPPQGKCRLGLSCTIDGSQAAEQRGGMSSTCMVVSAICKVVALNLYLDFANLPCEKVCENAVAQAY